MSDFHHEEEIEDKTTAAMPPPKSHPPSPLPLRVREGGSATPPRSSAVLGALFRRIARHERSLANMIRASMTAAPRGSGLAGWLLTCPMPALPTDPATLKKRLEGLDRLRLDPSKDVRLHPPPRGTFLSWPGPWTG